MDRKRELYGDHMNGNMSVSAHCSRFSRRQDFDMFNMSTYQSCENCRHMSEHNVCVVKAQKDINSFE